MLHNFLPGGIALLVSICATPGLAVPATTGASCTWSAERAELNPVIRPGMRGLEGDNGTNINGPSVIRVPPWVRNPLGKYYLYFAHHRGKYIRLAYANDPLGPWTIHAPGALALDQTAARSHIASPDVHVDSERQRIRMYFHGPVQEAAASRRSQATFVAESADGLDFVASDVALAPEYLRVFSKNGRYYGIAKSAGGGILLRSTDGQSAFEPGPVIVRKMRHAAILPVGDKLWLFHSRIGDMPEAILVSELSLANPWQFSQAQTGSTVLEPETGYEGVNRPTAKSRPGPASRSQQELRDPYVLADEGAFYLYYSVAGERGIAVAKLRPSAACGV